MDNNDSNQKVVSDSTAQPNLSVYDESNSFQEANKRKYSDAEDSGALGEEKHRKKKKKVFFNQLTITYFHHIFLFLHRVRTEIERDPEIGMTIKKEVRKIVVIETDLIVIETGTGTGIVIVTGIQADTTKVAIIQAEEMVEVVMTRA
jgi:hypothetical protein